MIKKILTLFMLFFSAVSYPQFGDPQASIQPAEHDFGNIKQGDEVSYEFNVMNSGGDVLKILNVRGSCGCTAAQPEKNELQPGESTKIKVTFNSDGRYGSQTKYVYVSTNDPKNSRLNFKFTGNVIVEKEKKSNANAPKIKINETQHDFGTLPEGKVAEHNFTLTNDGKNTLKIMNVRTTCDCISTVVSEKQIEPGKTGSLIVKLDTKNNPGRLSRNVVVYTNDPEEPVKVLNIYADIKKEVN